MDQVGAYLNQIVNNPTKTLVTKIREITRKLDSKLPIGSFGIKGEACRKFLVIELCCRLSDVTYNKEKLLNYCTVNKNEYQKLWQIAKTVLHLDFNSNMDQVLSIKYDAHTVRLSHTFLDCYIAIYMDSLQGSAKQYTVMTSAVNKCAAFILVAQSRKVCLLLSIYYRDPSLLIVAFRFSSQVKVDRAHLCSLGDVTFSDLKDAMSGMNAFMSGKGLSLESILSSGHIGSTDLIADHETIASFVAVSKEGTVMEEKRTCSVNSCMENNCPPSNLSLRREDRPVRSSLVQSFKNSSGIPVRRIIAQSEHTISGDLCPVDEAASMCYSSSSIPVKANSIALKSGTIRCREDYEKLRDSKLAEKRAKVMKTI